MNRPLQIQNSKRLSPVPTTLAVAAGLILTAINGIAQTVQNTITVPQGRKFIILSVSIDSYYLTKGIGCTFSQCPNTTVSFSLNGPGGQLLYSIAPVTGTLASPPAGAPPGTMNGDPLCFGSGCSACFQPGACGVQSSTGCGSYQACYNYSPNPPNTNWDWLNSFNESRSYKVIDVSSLTQSADATITETWTYQNPSTDWYVAPVEINVGVLGNGNTRFVVTQTRTNFRPMDARDPVAPCTASDPKDDCHATFKVQLVGNQPVPEFVTKRPSVPFAQPQALRQGSPLLARAYSPVDPRVTCKRNYTNSWTGCRIFC